MHSYKNYLGDEGTETFNVTSVQVCELPSDLQNMLCTFNGVGQDTTLASVERVKLNSACYAVGLAVLLGHDDLSYTFGQTEYIIQVHGAFYLACLRLDLLEFNEHYRAYLVKPSDIWCLVKPNELFDYHSLGMYTIDEEKAIVLKYYVHY